MARISLALAAAAVTATAAFGIHTAQAQMPAYGTQAPPAYQSAPPPPPTPMQAPMGAYAAPPPAPMGAPPMMGTPPMAHAPMGAAPMGARPMGGHHTADGRPVVPTPAQPFSNLELPRQAVGDGAYGGGGLVLEYLPDGTRRVVQQ